LPMKVDCQTFLKFLWSFIKFFCLFIGSTLCIDNVTFNLWVTNQNSVIVDENNFLTLDIIYCSWTSIIWCKMGKSFWNVLIMKVDKSHGLIKLHWRVWMFFVFAHVVDTRTKTNNLTHWHLDRIGCFLRTIYMVNKGTTKILNEGEFNNHLVNSKNDHTQNNYNLQFQILWVPNTLCSWFPTLFALKSLNLNCKEKYCKEKCWPNYIPKCVGASNLWCHKILPL